MIVRNYNHLKLQRTYIGASKKEEIKTFIGVQDIENIDDPQIDWFEFRRLSIFSFEDIIHVTFSRKIFSEITSYLLMFISFYLMQLNYNILFFICFGLSILSYTFFRYFMWKQKKEISNYNLVISLTNNMIQKESGMCLMSIE